MGTGNLHGKLTGGIGVVVEGCGRESDGGRESFVSTVGDGRRIDDANSDVPAGRPCGGLQQKNREKWLKKREKECVKNVILGV